MKINILIYISLYRDYLRIKTLVWLQDFGQNIWSSIFLILVYNYKSMMHHAMVVENQILYALLFS
jgi:hypothetical protein